MARGVTCWFRFGLVPFGTLLLGCGSEPRESNRMPAGPAPSATATTPACEKITVYPDADRDGHAGTSDSVAARDICAGEAAPDGYAPSPGFGKLDCDDADPSVFRSLCEDRDGDGAYDPNPVCVGDEPAGTDLVTCPFVLEWTPDPGPYDCDDTDPDRIDYFYRDVDGDGFGAGDELCFREEEGYSAWGGDCDDDDPNRAPLALEIFGDGQDSDCDGADGSVCTADLAEFEWPAVPDAPAADCAAPQLALGSLSCSSCLLTSATLAVENRGDSRFEGTIVISAVPGPVDLEPAEVEASFPVDLDPGERRVLVSGPFGGPYEIVIASPDVSDCSPTDNAMSVARGHCI